MSTCFHVKGKYFLFFILFYNSSFINIVRATVKVLTPVTSVAEADVGTHLVLFCNVSGHPWPQIQWLKDGRSLTPNLSWKLRENRSGLVSQAVHTPDAGNYTCITNDSINVKRFNIQLHIRTIPSKLVNVTVHPSTVVATIRWHVSNDGGYPISQFILIYRPVHDNFSDDWRSSQTVRISPAVRQYFLYLLKPATVYMFRLWAINKLGPGEAVTIQASTAKAVDPPDVLQHMMANSEEFSSAAWMVAISMVMGTVFILSCLSCILIYREGRNKDNAETLPRIIANPGFDVDLEESYLLDHADYNDNTERAVRTNNNTVIQPSRV